MQTFSLPFINGGNPFRVGPDQVTPEMLEVGITAKRHALIKHAAGLEVIEPSLRAEVIAEAKALAQLSQAKAYLHHLLCSIDPSLKARCPTPETLLPLLSGGPVTLVELLVALGGKKAKEASQDGTGPLAQSLP